MACVNNARVSDRHLRGWRGQLAVEVMLAWVSASNYIKGLKETVEAASRLPSCSPWWKRDLGQHNVGAAEGVDALAPRDASALEQFGDARDSSPSGGVDGGTREHPPQLVRRRLATMERRRATCWHPGSRLSWVL